MIYIAVQLIHTSVHPRVDRGVTRGRRERTYVLLFIALIGMLGCSLFVGQKPEVWKVAQKRVTVLTCAQCTFVTKDASIFSMHLKEHKKKHIFRCEKCNFSPVHLKTQSGLTCIPTQAQLSLVKRVDSKHHLLKI